MFLAMQIRERKLTTVVQEYCHSACTLVFQSGVRRIIHSDAIMMYHTTTNPEVDEPFGNILVRYGLSRKFYNRLLEKPGVDFDVTAAEILKIGAATEITNSIPFSEEALITKPENLNDVVLVFSPY